MRACAFLSFFLSVGSVFLLFIMFFHFEGYCHLRNSIKLFTHNPHFSWLLYFFFGFFFIDDERTQFSNINIVFFCPSSGAWPVDAVAAHFLSIVGIQ